ncbi:hypothetical protein SeMB42_g01180 [Synchytrium endobioticum]|nr:hypothetical protein SeMB42_g01180 [Synchytrium endobioticum]
MGVPFTTGNLKVPTIDMPQSYLEFCWEALKTISEVVGRLPVDLRKRVKANVNVCVLETRYRQKLSALTREASLGLTLGFLCSSSATQQASDCMPMISEMLRVSEIAESLRISGASTLSSVTQMSILLKHGCEWCSYGLCPVAVVSAYPTFFKHVTTTEVVNSLMYHRLVGKRLDLLRVTTTNFVRQRMRMKRLARSEKDSIKAQKSAMRTRWEDHWKHSRTYMEKLACQWDEEEEMSFGFYFAIVSYELAQLKEVDRSAKGYDKDEAIGRLETILAEASRFFINLREVEGIPSDVTAGLELLPPKIVPPKYMDVAAAYHQILLRRATQRLSLLQWFRNGYVIELLLQNPGVAVDKLDEAELRLIRLARNRISKLDAFEIDCGKTGAPQRRKHWASETERDIHHVLLRPDTYHLACTWDELLHRNINAYIDTVDSERQSIRKSPDYAIAEATSKLIELFHSDSLALIRHVHDIPPEISRLIQGPSVPQDLPPPYLRLAAALNQLVVFRLWREERLLEAFQTNHGTCLIVTDAKTGSPKTISADMVDTMLAKLSTYSLNRMLVFAAYEQAAAAMGVGVLPDIRTYEFGQTIVDAVTPRSGSPASGDVDGAEVCTRGREPAPPMEAADRGGLHGTTQTDGSDTASAERTETRHVNNNHVPKDIRPTMHPDIEATDIGSDEAMFLEHGAAIKDAQRAGSSVELSQTLRERAQTPFTDTSHRVGLSSVFGALGKCDGVGKHRVL